jgi:hypothetical protein
VLSVETLLEKVETIGLYHAGKRLESRRENPVISGVFARESDGFFFAQGSRCVLNATNSFLLLEIDSVRMPLLQSYPLAVRFVRRWMDYAIVDLDGLIKIYDLGKFDVTPVITINYQTLFTFKPGEEDDFLSSDITPYESGFTLGFGGRCAGICVSFDDYNEYHTDSS